MTDLHVKYRPKSFNDVVGQSAVLRSIKQFFKEGEEPPHLFLFSGESGVGKTTLARIIASEVGCNANAILEIDAATNSGVDSMRSVSEMVQYKALGSSPNRCVIIDECHALSGSAWKSLLKITEEPPSHVYFCLCTTELGKVPKTIKTRAHAYELQLVDEDDLHTLVKGVAAEEGIRISSKHIDLIAHHSDGSPRQALVNLSMCRSLRTTASIEELLKSSTSNKEVIELLRGLAGGKLSFKDCINIVKTFKNVNYESARIQLLAYMSKVLEGQASNERKAEQLLSIISCFSKPFNASTGKSDFYLALGNLFFEE